MLPNPHVAADLVTFTEEMLNGKLHFLCSVLISNDYDLLRVVLSFYFYLFHFLPQRTIAILKQITSILRISIYRRIFAITHSYTKLLTARLNFQYLLHLEFLSKLSFN